MTGDGGVVGAADLAHRDLRYPSIESLANYLSQQEPTGELEPAADETSRFPGSRLPSWALAAVSRPVGPGPLAVVRGKTAIREVPPDRWDAMELYDSDPAVPGKMRTRWGGFLEEIGHFEPQFFRISPLEARTIDPQHRLLLEVAWEAMEDAGLVPEQLAGTSTGVFIGIATNDYGRIKATTCGRSTAMPAQATR